MKLTAKLIAFLLACGGSTTLASTINSGAAVDLDFFSTILGGGLDSTYSVNVGWLDTATYDETDYLSVSGNYISLGSIAFPYGGNPSYNGFYQGQVIYDNTDFMGQPLAGENIFLFVTDGANDWALLEYTGSSPDNRINDDGDIPNNSNVFIEQANIGDYTIHAGSYGAGTLTLTAIPEPSVALLGGLGSLLLLRRRRGSS